MEPYRRDPAGWVAAISRTMNSSGMQIETDVRVRGTTKIEGHEFLVLGGKMRSAGRGEAAASMYGKPVPAGFTLDNVESISEMQMLVDPYSGAIERVVMTDQTNLIPKLGSATSIPMTLKTQFEYSAEIPRFYAAIPPPPPAAMPPSSTGPAPATPVPAPRVQTEPKSLVALYRETIGSVFTVRTDKSLGTAFAVGGNVLVTSRHVVEGATTIELANTGGQRFRARVLLPAVDVDIAYLVPATTQRLSYLTMAADVPPIGTKLVVIGSPAGLDGTLTTGTVSQLRPFKGRLVLQFEGFVSPGNSGGPIMDLEGKVLGIVMARGSPEVALGVNIGVSTVDVLGEAPSPVYSRETMM